MHFKMFDKMMFEGFKGRKSVNIQKDEHLWDWLSSTFITFLLLDHVIRPAHQGATIGDRIFYFFLWPIVGALCDFFLHIVIPALQLLGAGGQVHLPNLHTTEQLTPDDVFGEPLKHKDSDYLQPSSYYSHIDLGTCDGRYLWVQGMHPLNFLIALIHLGVIAAYVGDNHYEFMPVSLLFLLVTWFPKRKGALFNREAQTVTFYRGWLRKAITVPYSQTAFGSHLSGTGNLTQGLNLICKRRIKGKWFPLVMSLTTDGGNSTRLASEAGAIHSFMDLDNLGGFAEGMLNSIKTHRQYQLTMWRLNWRDTPEDEWQKYQNPNSPYHVDFDINTEAWRTAASADHRAHLAKMAEMDRISDVLRAETAAIRQEIQAMDDKKEKIARYVELMTTQQQNTDPELIAEVEAQWLDEARTKVIDALQAPYDAVGNYVYRFKPHSKGIRELYDIGRKLIAEPAEKFQIEQAIKGAEEFERIKKQYLDEGKIIADMYKQITVKP